MKEITSPLVFRDVVEARRQARDISYRGMAYAAETAHATYWFWVNKGTAEISLRTAIAFAKAVGLKLYLGDE